MNTLITLSLILNGASLIWLFYITFNKGDGAGKEEQSFEKIDSSNIAEVVKEHDKKLKKIDIDTKELYTIFEEQGKRLGSSITKCGVIRFNPFSGEGGNQSFSIALLNDQNTGVTISSLYSRNSGTRIYAKPIKNGNSDIALTKEEQEAIKIAS